MDFFEKIIVSIAGGIISSGITMLYTDKLNLIHIALIIGTFIVILGVFSVVSKRNKKETIK